MAIVTTRKANFVKLGSIIHYKGRTYVCVEHVSCRNCGLDKSNICGNVTCSWTDRNNEDPLKHKMIDVMFIEKKTKVRRSKK